MPRNLVRSQSVPPTSEQVSVNVGTVFKLSFYLPHACIFRFCSPRLSEVRMGAVAACWQSFDPRCSRQSPDAKSSDGSESPKGPGCTVDLVSLGVFQMIAGIQDSLEFQSPVWSLIVRATEIAIRPLKLARSSAPDESLDLWQRRMICIQADFQTQVSVYEQQFAMLQRQLRMCSLRSAIMRSLALTTDATDRCCVVNFEQSSRHHDNPEFDFGLVLNARTSEVATILGRSTSQVAADSRSTLSPKV